MKRIILYIGILAALLAAPVERADVGKLRPVQAVYIYKEKDWFVLETDTDDLGIGATAEQALRNLKDTTAGIIYLDTAEYLLLSKDAQEAAEELREELKDSVRLCLMAQKVDMKEAAKYLSAHGDLPKLESWKTGQELPVISGFGERITFLKKVENSA